MPEHTGHHTANTKNRIIIPYWYYMRWAELRQASLYLQQQAESGYGLSNIFQYLRTVPIKKCFYIAVRGQQTDLSLRTGEIAAWLRGHTSPTEELCSHLGTHGATHNCLNSGSRHPYTYILPRTYTIKNTPQKQIPTKRKRSFTKQ